MEMKDFKVGDIVMWYNPHWGYDAGKIKRFSKLQVIVQKRTFREYHPFSKEAYPFDAKKAEFIGKLMKQKNDFDNQVQKQIRELLKQNGN